MVCLARSSLLVGDCEMSNRVSKEELITNVFVKFGIVDCTLV